MTVPTKPDDRDQHRDDPSDGDPSASAAQTRDADAEEALIPEAVPTVTCERPSELRLNEMLHELLAPSDPRRASPSTR